MFVGCVFRNWDSGSLCRFNLQSGCNLIRVKQTVCVTEPLAFFDRPLKDGIHIWAVCDYMSLL